MAELERNVGLGVNNVGLERPSTSRTMTYPVGGKLSPPCPGAEETNREREDVSSGQATKEAKYLLYPVISPTSRSKTTPPVGRIPQPEDEPPIEMAKAPVAIKRLRSVGLLLRSSSRFRRKDGTGSARRKGSAPEPEPMTTVQEDTMDSPTLPWRHGYHERSSSVPDWNRQRSPNEARAPSPALSQHEQPDRTPPSPLGRVVTTIRRKPVSTKPGMLVIPTPELDSWKTRTTRAQQLREEQEERPEPPPKEPRMNGSPRPRVMDLAGNMSSLSLSSSPINTTPKPAAESNAQSKRPATAKEPTHYASERGRSTNRSDDESPILKSETDGSSSPERRLGLTLPQGLKAASAASTFSEADITRLHQQALGQAARFEVLAVRDVDDLSKELRTLDERCELLRREHSALRTRRQRLHSRMMTHLQSPRLAHFSREATLKQEQTLSELDGSIDNWVLKLDRAENRRARIRQKLLEHVAAAMMLKGDASSSPKRDGDANDDKKRADVAPAPPKPVLDTRTPLVVPQQQQPEDGTPPLTPDRPSTPPPRVHRNDIQSIRIYADANIYTLFPEMEQDMAKPLESPTLPSADRAQLSPGPLLPNSTYSRLS